METTRIPVQSTIQAVITFSSENGATLVTVTFDAEKENAGEIAVKSKPTLCIDQL